MAFTVGWVGYEYLGRMDVVHHQIQLTRPDLTMSFDGDPEIARATCRRTLARAVDEGLIGFPAQFRDPCAGRVTRDGSAYRYRFP